MTKEERLQRMYEKWAKKYSPRVKKEALRYSAMCRLEKAVREA